MSQDGAEVDERFQEGSHERRSSQGKPEDSQRASSKTTSSPNCPEPDSGEPELNICQDGSLCKWCESIDFDSLFDTNVGFRVGKFVLLLGPPDMHPVEKGCVMCRFMIHMGGLANFGDYSHLRAFPSLAILTDARNDHWNSDAVLSVESTFGMPLVRERDFGFIVPEASMWTDSRPVTLSYRGRSVQPLSINYEAIKTWLTKCQTYHSSTCGRSNSERGISLLCIECTTRRIVPITASDEYVALSYVWGSPSAFQNDQPASDFDFTTLPAAGIPQVIEDAILVTRQIGHNYLWVDKYCIDRRNKNSWMHQILNMHQIYEQAYATIVACAGTDATAGLPGVSSVRRKTQPSVELHDRRLVATLASLPSALEGSVWMSRGWTYQEFVLSSKCLFFCDAQVYFVCSSMSCRESVISDQDDTNLISPLEPGFLGAVIFGGTSPGPELRKFADHVRQYTGRDLTFDSDALNAFRGVLSRSRFSTYYGIPIAPLDTLENSPTGTAAHQGFARGLFWLPEIAGDSVGGLLRRRSEFPSWSWVGWRGKIHYPGYGYVYDDEAEGAGGVLIQADTDASNSLFWVEDLDGNNIPLDRLCDLPSVSRSILELSSYLQVEAATFLLRFQKGQTPRWWQRRPLLSVCRCHLDTSHDGTLNNDDLIGSVALCSVPDEGNQFPHRLTSQLWTCVLLFVAADEMYADSLDRYHNLLVVEWEGDIAYRIGSITLHGSSLGALQEILEPVHTRRRIRLG